MPQLSEQVSEKAKPWPGYFLVRTNGEVVPLIAVDELPPGTELKGVPRCLDLEDTIGMLNLGLQRRSETFYQIAKIEDKKQISMDLAIRNNTTEHSSPSRLTQPSTTPFSTIGTRSQATLTSPVQPSVETQLCRHWCTHGICKWGQNCRYRHIMPMTLSSLQEIGLTDWPTWYRTLNPGNFAAENMQRTISSRRVRDRPCAGSGCCGVNGHSGESSNSRLRGCPRIRGQPGHDRLRREDAGIGEEILKRLRALSKEGKKSASKNLAEKEVSNNLLLERAAIRETSRWEDESEASEIDEKVEIEEKKAKGVKEKLVDV